MNTTSRRISASLVRRSAPWVSASAVLAAVAVPVVQAVVMWRTLQPAIPGPHDQDGELPGVPDAGEPVDVVWLGDSLASGMGADSADAAFPRRAVTRWNAIEGRPVRLTCLARAGSRSSDVLAEQIPAAIALLGPGSVRHGARLSMLTKWAPWDSARRRTERLARTPTPRASARSG